MNHISNSAPARPEDDRPDRRTWLIVYGLCMAAAGLAAAAPLIAFWTGAVGSVSTSLVILALLAGIGGGLHRARKGTTAMRQHAPSVPIVDAAVVDDAWRGICHRYGWRLQVLAEQLRPELDALEASEADPESVRRLYLVDHAVTRMRRIAGDLRVWAGRAGEEVIGPTSSLLDVIRVAASAVEFYDRVCLGPVADLAVVAYAADDVALLLAALADNATRYSPGAVTISAHLLASGSVMVRIEDEGLGIDPGLIAALNAAMVGPVRPVDERTGQHTGFAVAHRLARKHRLRVQLAQRQSEGAAAAGGGTTAMVSIPVSLLCEIPERPPSPGSFPASTSSPPVVAPTWAPERESPSPGLAAPAADPQAPRFSTTNRLPLRQRTSVRTHPPGRERSPEQALIPQRPASGHSFAEDVSAFTASASSSGPDTGAGADHHNGAEGPRP